MARHARHPRRRTAALFVGMVATSSVIGVASSVGAQEPSKGTDDLVANGQAIGLNRKADRWQRGHRVPWPE